MTPGPPPSSFMDVRGGTTQTHNMAEADGTLIHIAPQPEACRARPTERAGRQLPSKGSGLQNGEVPQATRPGLMMPGERELLQRRRRTEGGGDAALDIEADGEEGRASRV